MSFVTSNADLNALYTGIQQQILDAYLRYRRQMRGMAIEVMSTNVREAYPIQAIKATMTRWAGNREIGNLLQKVQYVENGKPWQNAIAIARKDVELKGRTLDLGRVAAMQGKAAKAQYDEIVKSLLQNGASTVCIDGANFFSATHPVVPWDASYGTFTNLRTTFPLNRANFRIAYQAMLALKGWDLQPFEVDKFYLVIPPQLQAQAQDIVDNPFAPVDGTQTGTSVAANNVDYRKAEIIMSQKLSNESDVWYLVSTIRPPAGEIDQDAEFGQTGPLAGPFAIQQWRALEVVPRFSPESNNVFERDEYEIGISLGLEGGYLLPQHAVRCEA